MRRGTGAGVAARFDGGTGGAENSAPLERYILRILRGDDADGVVGVPDNAGRGNGRSQRLVAACDWRRPRGAAGGTPRQDHPASASPYGTGPGFGSGCR